jgi:hypothetical protein
VVRGFAARLNMYRQMMPFMLRRYLPKRKK